jgi:DNA-directed RNA polymerase
MSNEVDTIPTRGADMVAKLLRDALQEEKDQIKFEMAGADEGADKFRRMIADPATKLADTGAGRKIFKEVMSALVPAIKAEQELAEEGIANGGRGPRPVWWWYLPFVSADKLAYIGLRSVLGVRMRDNHLGRSARQICLTIGLAVKQQVEFEAWLRKSKEESSAGGGPDMAARLVRRAKNFNQRQWGNWTRRIKSIETVDWKRDVKMHVGAKMLQILVEQSLGFFELRYVQIRNKTERHVFLTDACRAMINDINSGLEVNSPVLKPMLIPPRPWQWDHINKRYDGGYYMLDVDFIRGGLHKHTAALENPLSETTVEAANALGTVPFQVDSETLSVARENFTNDLDLIECMPSPDAEDLPEKIPDEEWEQMDKVSRAEWKYNLSKIHGRNASEVSRRESVLRKFATMQTVADRPVYNVIKCDSRGRFYYVTPDWNPQADSLGRGTMRFWEELPLGPRGLYWLAVRLCNTYGYDKVTFDQMQAWAKEHHDLIVDSARRPFDGERFWASADSELEFLQTCIEWANATECTNPEKYMSTLPVHQDGSNNGLQLLSLLGRDPVGARLTNCSADPTRYDIYSETAEVVKRLINEDIMAGQNLEQAQKWVGNVDRSVCKRACMTTSYGVTPRGIQDQLISDGFTDKLDGNRLENASYMRDKLIQALEQTVVASRPIMQYFQQTAAALGEFDLPLRWQTPVGSTIQQAYWRVAKSDVKTVMGSYFLWDENPMGGLNVRKQQLSSSPNIIHSLDAALMQSVVLRLTRDHGVNSIAAIHDSFAVHPCNVDLMRLIIQEEAYTMFKGNWIADQFHPYIRKYAKGVELPPIPRQGDFDVSEVLKAQYFFA